MDPLPEYNNLYRENELPTYHYLTKHFFIKTKPTLNLNLEKLSWNLCEKKSGQTCYKIYAKKREITLKDNEKYTLMQLMESPSKQSNIKYYNFIINNFEEIEVLMKRTTIQDRFFYKIDIIYLNIEGNQITSYGIHKKKSKHLDNGIWCLYKLDNPLLNIIKFIQYTNQDKVADIVFYQHVPQFEFHIFLLAIAQCVYQTSLKIL